MASVQTKSTVISASEPLDCVIESLFVFLVQNAARIVRALFEIALRKRWPAMTYRLLNLCKVIDKRLWGWAHPLRQFSVLPPSVLSRMEERKLTVDKLRDMGKDEIGWSDTSFVDLPVLDFIVGI